ncbi:MAG TPA: polynucleotide adenylyltransferase PcnB [Planctomycetota bacterium]|nr:polynucleotide adenylyltransferase PcnB [Planctomycetota bacterium]
MSHEPVRYADTLIFPASLDPDAVATVRRLNEAGLQAYLVGGCVRDLLLGLIPKDFDVSTEARPRQIRRLFRNSRIIGRRFKLAHVHWPGGKIIEVATFRATPEGSGEPGVATQDLLITRDNEFGSAEEDVLRRDFTINALLFDVRTNEVIDYVGGVQDLKDRLLRTIGDPATRFAEDPVRMLRAMKFLARLQLQPTPEVAAAMSASAELIGRSSPARVLEEIYKLMACGRAQRALPLLVEHGLLQRLLPEVAPYWTAHPEQLAAAGAALDRIDRGRRRVGNDQLLAILCLGPWIERTREPPPDPLLLAHDLFDHAALRMSIPRKDMASMRHALTTLVRLERPRRSRRFRLSDFLRRPATMQAIELLYIAALAGLADPEHHAHWAQRLAEQGPGGAGGPRVHDEEELQDADAPHDAEAHEREDVGERGERRDRGEPGHRSRRRRRGGRGRRRGRDRQGAPAEGRPFGPQPEGPAAAQPAEAQPGLEAAASADRAEAAGSAGEFRQQNGHAEREGGGRGGRRRRRGRRGGARRGGGQAPAAPAPGAEPVAAQGAARAEPSPARESGRDEARHGSQQGGQPREGGRRARGRRRSGRREDRPVHGGAPREQKATRDPPGAQQGPGARNPEDVEDFFDW